MRRNTKFSQEAFAAELSERLLEIATQGPTIKKYRPHAKQAEFHRAKRKGKLYIGGNRSGKTTGGVTEAIWRATKTHPYRPELNAIPGPIRGRVVAVDFVNGVEKIIFPQYKQWLYPSALRGGSWETAFDKFTKVLNFSNGSFIEFMSYDQDLDKFAGTSRHWIHFDEECPKNIFNECMARLIDTDGEYWITMTPVEGMTWIYDDLYEKNVNNPDGTVFVIEINTLENPYLSQTAIQHFVDGIDDDEKTIRIGGNFVRQGGRIYKNFDPTPGGLNVLSEPFDRDELAKLFKGWLWICALDHGLNNPTAVLWLAFDWNGFGVCFDEHYQKELTVDQHAKKILAIMEQHGRRPDLMVADPSIVNRNAITGTSVQQEYQKYGLSWMEGNNDVTSGIIRVKRHFNRVKYVGARTSSLFSGDTDEFPRLRITPNCSNLIWELKRYRWKTYANKKLQYENNPYDTPHKKDDHACDALRYAIMTQPDLTAEKPGESLANKVDTIMERMGASGPAVLLNDPNDLLDPTNQWGPDNSMPRSDNDWQFDEHMGIEY